MYVSSARLNYVHLCGIGTYTWCQHRHLEPQQDRREDRNLLMGD